MTISFDDWRAICETKARYCRCLDTKDWAGLADCFTEDYTLRIMDEEPLHGRDTAIASMRQRVGTAITAHQVHNPEITLGPDGDSADVIWALNDRVIWPEPGGRSMTGYAHYREHYVRCDDGRWRIKRLALSYLHKDFHPIS